VFKWINSLLSDKSPESEPDKRSVLTSIEADTLPEELKALHSKALDHDALATFKLALRYYNGTGTAQDYDLAYGIFQLLLNRDADAEFYMGEICRQGLKGEPDYEQACCHYAAAVSFGFPQAKERLTEIAEITGDDFWLTWGDKK